MKTSIFLPLTVVLAFSLTISTSDSFAGANPGFKASHSWLKEFDKKINYNPKNKSILKNAVVLLEISVAEDGTVSIENCNSSKPEAADYVIEKLKGIYLKETSVDRFILKYSFK